MTQSHYGSWKSRLVGPVVMNQSPNSCTDKFITFRESAEGVEKFAIEYLITGEGWLANNPERFVKSPEKIILKIWKLCDMLKKWLE